MLWNNAIRSHIYLSDTEGNDNDPFSTFSLCSIDVFAQCNKWVIDSKWNRPKENVIAICQTMMLRLLPKCYCKYAWYASAVYRARCFRKSNKALLASSTVNVKEQFRFSKHLWSKVSGIGYASAVHFSQVCSWFAAHTLLWRHFALGVTPAVAGSCLIGGQSAR